MDELRYELRSLRLENQRLTLENERLREESNKFAALMMKGEALREKMMFETIVGTWLPGGR